MAGYATLGDGAGPAEAPEDSRPLLEIVSAAESVEWLRTAAGAGPLAGMFLRRGELVHCPRITDVGYVAPREGTDGPAQVRPLDGPTLAARVQLGYRPFKSTGSGRRVKVLFPREAAIRVVGAIDAAPNVRVLRAVTHTPIVRADGSILERPGYDDATRMLHLPDPGLHVPQVPDDIGALELCQALDLIDHMLDGFSFVTESDRANYLGLLLTPLIRELCPPPYKFAIIQAHQRGSGKGFLAYALRELHGGALRPSPPSSDEELRKQITSILSCTTAPVVTWDNLSGTLRSPHLDALFTSTTWSDRPLGSTADVTASNDRLWTGTGNNVQIGGDLARRTLWVTIDPGVPNPEHRTDFKIGDFKRWVAEHRGQLLHALLTIVAWWVDAGRPLVDSPGSDDYAHWVRTVRSILDIAGIPGVFDDPETAVQIIGDDDQEWHEFLTAVHGQFGTQAWTVREVLLKVDDGEHASDLWALDHPIPLDALPTELAEKARKARAVKAIAKSLGRWIARRVGQYPDGSLTVQSAGRNTDHRSLWQVVPAPGLKPGRSLRNRVLEIPALNRANP